MSRFLWFTVYNFKKMTMKHLNENYQTGQNFADVDVSTHNNVYKVCIYLRAHTVMSFWPRIHACHVMMSKG